MKSNIWDALSPEEKEWFQKLRAEIKEKFKDRLANINDLNDWMEVHKEMIVEEIVAGVSYDQERIRQIPDYCPRCGRSMRKYKHWRQYAGHNGVCKLAYEQFYGDLKAAFERLTGNKKRRRNWLRHNTDIDLDNFYNDPQNIEEAAASAYDWDD